MNTRCNVDVSEVGSWQEYFDRSCTDRVKKAIERAVRIPEVCLEHALTEIEVMDQVHGKVPHIIERAMIFGLSKFFIQCVFKVNFPGRNI